MALINVENYNYYKINFEKCKIMGNNIYSNYSIYVSEHDRVKEKQRYDERTAFCQKLREYIFNGQKSIDEEFEKYKVDPHNPLSNFSLIPEEVLVTIKQQEEHYGRLEEIERALLRKFYVVNNETHPIVDVENFIEILNNLGFKSEWTRDPINLYGETEIYCGEYNGEKIESSLFYNKIKTVMLETLVDC